MSFRNPTEKWCWVTCASCFRCHDKGRYPSCGSCSGRSEALRVIEPDPDDYCDCRNGILRYRTKSGRFIMRKFMSNPYKGEVKTDAETQDERDWNAFIDEKREKMDDPTWDPIQMMDGASAREWYEAWKKGRGRDGEWGY